MRWLMALKYSLLSGAEMSGSSGGLGMDMGASITYPLSGEGQVSGFRYQVSSFKCQVSGVKFQVSGAWFLGVDGKCLPPDMGV